MPVGLAALEAGHALLRRRASGCTSGRSSRRDRSCRRHTAGEAKLIVPRRALAADRLARLGIQHEASCRRRRGNTAGRPTFRIELLPTPISSFLPDLARLRDVAGQPGLDRRHRAASSVPVGVLFAVPHIDDVAIDRRRDVQPAARELILPDDLARPRLQGIHPAVARAADQQLLAADRGDHRRGIDRVRRTQPRADEPDESGRSRLSNAMKRWAGIAMSPQPMITEPRITRSSNTTGKFVRPP